MPRRDDIKKIMIVGSGPIVIGQACEFDYSGVQACKALREEGYELVLVNSNPETVSTDYDTSDRLYFEPLTVEDVLHIYHRERCWGAIVQFGGQTPLNLAHELERNGVNIIGTRPESIDIAEDRERFAELVTSLGLKQPPNGMATNTGEVMGIDIGAGMAFLKSQVTAGNSIPAGGNVFISVRDGDKQAMLPLARRLSDMGVHECPQQLAQRNAFAGAPQAVRHVYEPVFAVQYHPEAAPGPHDPSYLFKRFRDLIEKGAT